LQRSFGPFRPFIARFNGTDCGFDTPPLFDILAPVV
jgi:hypothetical protein